MSVHTARAFDADLQELNRMIVEMGRHSERQLIEALDALLKRDCSLAKRVVTGDERIDCQQRKVEQKAIATIATRQPVSIDLREILAVLRIAGELERIGDLAKNIGKRVIVLNRVNMPPQALRGVVQMTDIALKMLKDVLDSYANRDGCKAIEVWNGDDQIDALYTSLFRQLLIRMLEDPKALVYGVHLLFCGKNIERVGDHATNIAESVYYLVEGRTLEGVRPKLDSTSIVTADSCAASAMRNA